MKKVLSWAFPCNDTATDPELDGKSYDLSGHNGMTLREWYAGQALALGGKFFHDYSGNGGIHDIVTVAHEIADAMIAEGNKEKA